MSGDRKVRNEIWTLSVVFILLFQTINLRSEESTMKSKTLLIDDFSNNISPMGTVWEGFTDRVMGGVSDMKTSIVEDSGNNSLHLTGNVSLRNNGGFIQVRLFLNRGKKPYDASPYKGIAMRVRGSGDSYYVHLRTTRTIFPWSYYAQSFTTTEQWSRVYLPFSDFKSENMLSSKLNPSKLLSVAVVAAKKEFIADLYVDSIELYR
jgi:hypothetical protein